jgi:ABC-2 type transport system ATP-binding protein
VGVIRQGKLLATGSPDVLRQRSGRPQAEIVGEGFTPAVLALLRARADVASAEVENGRLVVALRDQAKMAPIVTALVEAGAGIEEVRRGQASLEDVFLSLMEEGERP